MTEQLSFLPKKEAKEEKKIRTGWTSQPFYRFRMSKALDRYRKNPNIFREDPDFLGATKSVNQTVRSWLYTLGLADKKGLTTLGELIHENDPYFQNIGTILYFHSKIVEDTSWGVFLGDYRDYYDVFTDYDIQDFFFDNGYELRKMIWDFGVLKKTYIPPTGRIDPEDDWSIFWDLKLLKRVGKGYRLRRVDPKEVSPYLILSHFPEQEGEYDLDHLTKKLQRYYRLSRNDIFTLFKDLERNTDILTLIWTAGLNVIRIKKRIDPFECLKEIYR